MSKLNLRDYNELVKNVKIANQRIQKIQNRYGEDSWAINELYNKINNKNLKAISDKTGGIKINKSMSDIQLKMIDKATQEFLGSKTSTLRGVKSAIKTTKNSLKATFGDEAHKISDKEINFLYDLVEDKNKRDLTENIGASEVWAKLIQAKEENLKLSEFRELFSEDIDINEKDTKAYLREIYYKYKRQ